jgi:hypothetical protein
MFEKTSRSFRIGSRIAPPITDLASSLHVLSVVDVYYGSLTLPHPPFRPLTWHAHPLKKSPNLSLSWLGGELQAAAIFIHPTTRTNVASLLGQRHTKKNLNRDLGVRRR